MRIAQPLVRALHVAYDNGDVLKPAIIAARVGGNGAASRPCELHKLDVFIPEPHPHHPYARGRCTFQTLVIGIAHGLIRNLLERQHLGIELERPVRIGDGYLDGSNTLNQWAWGLLSEDRAGQQQNNKKQDESELALPALTHTWIPHLAIKSQRSRSSK